MNLVIINVAQIPVSLNDASASLRAEKTIINLVNVNIVQILVLPNNASAILWAEKTIIYLVNVNILVKLNDASASLRAGKTIII